MSPASNSRRSASVFVMPSLFDFVGLRVVDVDSGEDVVDLAHAVDFLARLADKREVVRLPRPERPVVAVRRSRVVARLSDERAGDHAPDRVLPRQNLAGDPAGSVELVKRDRLLVRGDLKDGVGGRIDDPLAGPLVFLAELFDDVRPRGGLVAEHPAPRPVGELLDDLERKSMWEGRHRLWRDDPHELPVARGRVLALRALEQPSRDGRSMRLRRAAGQLLDVSEAELLEVGEVEAADRFCDVGEGVRSLVAVVGRVRQLARTNRVQHDHAGARHRAILRPTWKPSSGFSAWRFGSSPSSRSPRE